MARPFGASAIWPGAPKQATRLTRDPLDARSPHEVPFPTHSRAARGLRATRVRGRDRWGWAGAARTSTSDGPASSAPTAPMAAAAARPRSSRRPRSSARAASASCPAPRRPSTGTGPALHGAAAAPTTTARTARAASKTDPTDPRCKTGFTCMWPTTVGSFCCQKMCVCRDFVTEPMGGFKQPEVCTSTSSGCQNVH